MKSKPKLVVLRGKVATGKSTAFHNLQKNKEMKNWIFVDHVRLKKILGKEKGKLALFSELKDALSTKNNIIIEEMSKETLMKYIGKDIRKHKYELLIFQFEGSLKGSIKKEAERRARKGKKPLGEKWVKKMHEHHKKISDPQGIIVDTDRLSRKGVVDFILKKLK